VKVFGTMAVGIFELFLFVVCLTLLASQNTNQDFNYNEVLNWSKYSDAFEVNESNSPITNIAFKVIDAAGYGFMEASKVGVEFADENLKIKPIVIINLLLFGIIAPILLNLLKIGLIIYIFCKDFITSKKEKKILDELREKK